MFVFRDLASQEVARSRDVHRFSHGHRAFYLLVLFFFLFLISCVVCFMYKTPYAARAMKRKKPINPSIPTGSFTSLWERSSSPNRGEKSPPPSARDKTSDT